MAIYHLNAHVVSRGKGQSAIAKAAYNSRTKLEDERTELSRKFSYAIADKTLPEKCPLVSLR